MSDAEQVRHYDGALHPSKQPKPISVWRWWVLIGVVIGVLVLIGKYRPQWLAKIGITFPEAGAAGAAGNPLGWV